MIRKWISDYSILLTGGVPAKAKSCGRHFAVKRVDENAASRYNSNGTNWKALDDSAWNHRKEDNMREHMDNNNSLENRGNRRIPGCPAGEFRQEF